MLSLRVKRALRDVSKLLDVNPIKLQYLIQFESNWKPAIKNPYSSARGLIQFVDKTAQGLGFQNSLDLVSQYPDIESQLRGPVYNYLKRYKPFPTDQSLFMAVFFPVARYWPSGKQFPNYVQKVNPGIRTPGDYTRKVYSRLGLYYISPVAIIATMAIGYFLIKQQKE